MEPSTFQSLDLLHQEVLEYEDKPKQIINDNSLYEKYVTVLPATQPARSLQG